MKATSEKARRKSVSPVRGGIIKSFTGVLIIENALSLFHTQDLARRNYLTELTEILHGTLLGDSAWDSRGVFGISVWGPRYGVPLGSWGGPKIWQFFFQFFHFFLTGNVSWSLRLLINMKISPSFNLFWPLVSLTREGVFIFGLVDGEPLVFENA